jgi:membrane-associated phospholipid phosphatase
MTTYSGWLNCQNGMAPAAQQLWDLSPRYLRDGRDLAECVHKDFTYQVFLNTALILLSFGSSALDDANPYKSIVNQSGFATFGAPHILDAVAHVANCALKAVWFPKWLLHRRLRPEQMAGRVHNHRIREAEYPIHPKLLEAHALSEVFDRTGSYLLPMAYPEGCPTHPSYPAGHAAIAGACTTILKAFFKESYQVPTPVIASEDGLSLAPYGGTLTVGDELNKLAANISLSRDTAGVHYRSDGIEGIKLGEALAISTLRDYRSTFNENFAGFSLTKFDGTSIIV